MRVAEFLQDELANWAPPGAGRHSLALQLPERPWALSLAADRVESLGALVWELTLTRPEASELSLDEAAARFVERSGGAMEPLTIHEIDAQRGEAMLRSAVPLRDRDTVFYFELFLEGPDRLTLRRYKVSNTAKSRREQVAFPMTHESAARLVDGLTA